MENINDLIITAKTNTEPLSKKAIQFNKLLLRIQKAETKLADTKNKLDLKFVEFSQKVLPLHYERCKIQLDIVKEILTYISSNKISNTREEILKEFCINTADQIAMGPHGLTEEKFEDFKSVLKKIYPDFDLSEDESNLDNETTSDTDRRAEALEMTKDMFRMQLEMLDIEVNLDDITADMSDEEIAEAFDKKLQAADPRYHATPKKPRKKSKAQLRKEAAKKEFHDMKEKTFSSMYKSLVKLIHPDGEQDEKMKEKKSEWMKRLTVAYKKKDLKTMMHIELEWLHGAKDEIEKMSEEKMGYFIEMLKEQAAELDQQNAMAYADPRYSAMLYFVSNPYQLDFFKPTAYSKLMIEEMDKEKEILANLRKSSASARKQIIQIVEDMKEEMMDDFYGFDF